jgi:hypothetical protein
MDIAKAKLKWRTWVPPLFGEIDCQFNPSELTISKETSWDGDASPSFNAPLLHFSGGESASYSLSLFFDSYSHSNEVVDVRKYTNQLLRLTLRGAGYSMFMVPYARPPVVTFVWGSITLFNAVVEKVEISYTMFAPDGMPTRAKADVDFLQDDFWDDLLPAQNPTSRSDSRRTRIVNSRQRLDQIAYEEYGDARYWRLLADANHMDDPFSLRDGQVLVIPTAER